MTTFKKNYIGKGKKVSNLDIVKVSICMEDAEPHFHIFDGKRYLTFEVATLRETDKHGKTHTVYVSVKEN